MEPDEAQKVSGYNKRPLWQWIALYVIIAILVYGLIYYFVLAKKGRYNSNQAGQYQQPTQTQTQQVVTQPSSSTSANVKSQQITVEGTEFSFSPSTITVKKGQMVQVTFKNIGKYPHNFTLSDLNVKTKTIMPGQEDTITFTPTQTGSFTYICTVPGHADRGMKGTLIVQ